MNVKLQINDPGLVINYTLNGGTNSGFQIKSFNLRKNKLELKLSIFQLEKFETVQSITAFIGYY